MDRMVGWANVAVGGIFAYHRYHRMKRKQARTHKALHSESQAPTLTKIIRYM